MTLKELIAHAAEDLAQRFREGAADGAAEFGLDSIMSMYRKFCQFYARKYLDRNNSDHEVLHTFREKFYQMMRISGIAIDETDTYLVGRYVDRLGHVEEVYMDVPRIRREVQKAKNASKKEKKS